MINFIKWLVFGGFSPARQRRSRRLAVSDIKRLKAGWAEVEELVKLGGPSRLRQAVIKADKLLERALTRMTGHDTLAAALKESRDLFSCYQVYDETWKAHKVRNVLVHDMDHEPSYALLTKSIKRFRIALEELTNGL